MLLRVSRSASCCTWVPKGPLSVCNEVACAAWLGKELNAALHCAYGCGKGVLAGAPLPHLASQCRALLGCHGVLRAAQKGLKGVRRLRKVHATILLRQLVKDGNSPGCYEHL